MNTALRPLGIAILLVIGFAGIGRELVGQTIEEELDQVTRHLEAARANHLNLIAPRSFGRADQKFAEAKGRYERGGNIGEIRRLLQDVRASLTEASTYQELGKLVLRDALAARSDALTANAPEFAPEEWKRAEATTIDGGRRIESGDQNGAQQRAARAVGEYREAEFQAIRGDLLGKAQQLRDQAIKADVHRKAPRTFTTAQSYLEQAEQQLQGDRYAKNEAAKLARAAADEFRHASLIGGLVDEVDRDKRPAVEKLQLTYEAEVVRIVEALQFEASFADGIKPVTDQVLDAIRGLYEDRNNLRADLAGRTRELAMSERRGDSLQSRLTRMVDSLGGQLALIEQRERRVATELRERQRREQKLRRIQEMFAPDQAEVLTSGDEMIIRLYALSFPVGSSEIRPANFSLLTTVQRALREFPDARVAIEGHTDSQGNDEFNQALSQRRADAVRDYLMANMGLDGSGLTAIGFGETRPIANNETVGGRAKNRRIDIRLYLSQAN